METVKFKFQMQSPAHPEQNFTLSSDGRSIEYKGKDRNSQDMSVQFEIPREIIKLAQNKIEPVLKETSDFDLSKTTDTGCFWTMKYNISGVTISLDGYIDNPEDFQKIREATRETVGYLESDPSLAEAYPNLHALKTLVEQAAVFA